MSFESVVEKRGPKPDPDPKLVIYPSGEARLNTTATERYFPDAERAALYTDAERGRLALAAATTNDAVKLVPRKRARYLAVRSALRDLDVEHSDIESSVHLPLAYDSDSGLVVADARPLFEEVDG